MSASRGFVAAALVLATGVVCSIGLSGQDKTAWDGVYSDAQAARGQTLWADKCAKCHGEDLNGGDGPALTGDEFGVNWDDLSLGDLSDRIRISMPQDNPQSLTREQSADLVALILKSYKMPPGQGDLPSQAENLKAIKFKAKKP